MLNFEWNIHGSMIKKILMGTIANANEGGILVYLPERLAIGDLFKIKIFSPGTQS